MPTVPLHTKNIFLADDDTDDRSLFKDALDDIDIKAQLNVMKDGEELMKVLNITALNPDIIFLDLNMPRKNGFECLREIRGMDKLKQIPVVIFSTSNNTEAIDTTYQLGADMFVRKPHSFGLLKKAIRIVLTTDFNMKNPKENYLLKVE